jgi:FMN-dependent NADH-azoreductase
MYVFMHGLASNNYDRFSYAIQQGASSTSAFLIPSMIVRFNLEQRVKALNLWQDKIYWHERRVGIRFDHHDNPKLSSIDFSTLSKDLNAANTNLAYAMWSCKSTTRMLDFLDQVAKRYKTQAIANKTSEEDATEMEQLLIESHAQMRSWNAGLEDRTEYLSKRGQALVQTVSTN